MGLRVTYIRLDVRKEGKSIKISVTDEGPGFSDEVLRHAGELFWQDDKSRTNGRHHGLGLASVKQIVSELGGEVYLKNTDNAGACVELLILDTEEGSSKDVLQH